MPLPKRHAEAGQVSLCEGYFYFTGFTGPSQGVEAVHGAEEEEASGACWEAYHHIRKWDQSFPTARGQVQSQRASMLRRLDGAFQQAPNTWGFLRFCPRINQSWAKKLLPAAGNPDHPGEGRRTRLYSPGPSSRLSQVGRSSPQTWIRTCPNPMSHPRQPTGACLATCPGL